MPVGLIPGQRNTPVRPRRGCACRARRGGGSCSTTTPTRGWRARPARPCATLRGIRHRLRCHVSQMREIRRRAHVHGVASRRRHPIFAVSKYRLHRRALTLRPHPTLALMNGMSHGRVQGQRDWVTNSAASLVSLTANPLLGESMVTPTRHAPFCGRVSAAAPPPRAIRVLSDGRDRAAPLATHTQRIAWNRALTTGWISLRE